jgi:hypothetical protein
MNLIIFLNKFILIKIIRITIHKKFMRIQYKKFKRNEEQMIFSINNK